MLAEIGLFAMVLALLAALTQSIFGLAGPWLGRESWTAAVRPAVTVQFWTTTFSLGVLVAAFVQNDFSVEYVAANSNSALPVGYRIAAVWGAHEGSLLLWAWILVAWTLAVSLLSWPWMALSAVCLRSSSIQASSCCTAASSRES